MESVNPISIVKLDDLEDWIRAYGGAPLSPSAQLIQQAIGDFQVFSRDYLGYFLDKLPPDPQRTPDQHRLWMRALQAFNEYWAPLGEVAVQHLFEPYTNYFETGTRIAQEYVVKLDIGLPGVVVYFNKVTSIRFVPYTNVAFLAVPYTHIERNDWMAIPHEIGHYLYWNLADNLVDVRTKHEEIRDKVRARLVEELAAADRSDDERDAIVSMALNWIEECFADVVGVKLAGAEFVESFRTLMIEVSGSVDSLTEDDGCHPPLCLRPFVREYVMQKLNMPATGIDWPGLIRDWFTVADFDELILRAQPSSVEELFRAQTLDDLIALLSGREDTVSDKIYPVTWKITDAIEAVSKVVDLLFDITPDFTRTIQNRVGNRESAFTKLCELANDQKFGNPLNPDEVLLAPVVLEGGQRHKHTTYGHFRGHEFGVHHH